MSGHQRRLLATTLDPHGATMDKKPSVYTLRKRLFLNPISTGFTSFILAEVESSQDGAYKHGNYLLTLADCKHRIQYEFFLGTKEARRIALRKINLLIEVLTQFRDALQKEIALIEKGESGGQSPKKTGKTSR
jgi:hypothetical protein